MLLTMWLWIVAVMMLVKYQRNARTDFFRLQNEWKIETYLRFSVLKPVLAFYSEVYWRKKYVKKQEIALELISGFNNVGKNLFGRHLIQYITFAPNL